MIEHRRLGAGARRAGIVAALAVAGVLLGATPASADLVDPAGSCVGTGTFADGGFIVDSATADPTVVIEVPRADQVAWTGAVVGLPEGAQREIAGSVSLALPAPLGAWTIDDWSGPATATASAGTRGYDLPALVPAGVVFRLHAEHHENGRLYCRGTAQLRIAGSPLGSPLTWASLGLAVALGVLLGVVGLGRSPGVGRLVGGGVLGLFFGAFAGLSLVFLGVSPLDSPVPLVAGVLGLAGGAVWGRLSPLGRLRPPVDAAGPARVSLDQ